MGREKNNKTDNFNDDLIEIKISNLPQWASWNNIKELIDSFYRNHLKQRYIPKYKIKMIPNDKTIAEWKEYQNVDAHCKRRLAEYDRMAFVQFENKLFAEKAIKTLNGHRYEYNILQVEMAKPRKY